MGSTSMQYENEYELWLKKVTKSERAVLCGMRKAEIEDAFCKSLNFGTGGLRGIMGLGTNRMNIYTVSKATQGRHNKKISSDELYGTMCCKAHFL